MNFVNSLNCKHRLLWKMLYLVYWEYVATDLADLEMYFKLYPLSLRRTIHFYLSKTIANGAAPAIHLVHKKVTEMMDEIDHLSIAVFMMMLPIQEVAENVGNFNFRVEELNIDGFYSSWKMTDPQNIQNAKQALTAMLKQCHDDRLRPDPHLSMLFNIYKDIADTFGECVQTWKADKYRNDIDGRSAAINDILDKKQEEAPPTDAVGTNHLLQRFDQILMAMGDCEDSRIYIHPAQNVVKYYLDAIVDRDDAILSREAYDAVHFLYFLVLHENTELCESLLAENCSELRKWRVYDYSEQMFATKPHLLVGLLSALCADEVTTQIVVDLFNGNDHFGMFRSYIDALIEVRDEETGQVTATQEIEMENIIIPQGTGGVVYKAPDKRTECVTWQVPWNGLLWAVCMLYDCIANEDRLHRLERNRSQNGSDRLSIGTVGNTGMDGHDEITLKRITMPFLMRLLAQIAKYHPEEIQVFY